MVETKESDVAFEDYQQKESVVVVYTGNSKGKTSASLGMMCRALGRDWNVAYIQFIKNWEVGEHTFIERILPLFGEKLTFFKGGKGFYNAGDLSPQSVSDQDHRDAALDTYEFALGCTLSGEFDLVICDELNNAVNDGLLSFDHLETLLATRAPHTSLCITGRSFPAELLEYVDIATSMGKIKHHFDEKFLANKGIDY